MMIDRERTTPILYMITQSWFKCLINILFVSNIKLDQNIHCITGIYTLSLMLMTTTWFKASFSMKMDRRFLF